MEEDREAQRIGGWVRAMNKAREERLHAERINDRLYTVRSTSKTTCTRHIVELDMSGKIASCSDCPGWEHYAAAAAEGDYRRAPCKHAAAVCSRLMRERHCKLPKLSLPAEVVERPATTRGQLFRTQAA